MTRRLNVYATDCMPLGIPLKHPIAVAAPSIEDAAKALKVPRYHLMRHRLATIPEAARQQALQTPGIRIMVTFLVGILLAGCAGGPAEGPNGDQTVPDAYTLDFDRRDNRTLMWFSWAEENVTTGRWSYATDHFQQAMYAAEDGHDWALTLPEDDLGNATAAYFYAAHQYAEAGFYCYQAKSTIRTTTTTIPDCDRMPNRKADMQAARSELDRIRAGGA